MGLPAAETAGELRLPHSMSVVHHSKFFIFPNWTTLIALGAATWLLHRQVLREEEYLGRHYGQAYAQYRRRV